MTTLNRIVLVFILAGCGFLFSCQRPPTDRFILGESLNLPPEPYNYANPPLPAFFKDSFITRTDNTPADNPINDWGATLGRVLFYDKELSLSRTKNCASCHNQNHGFSDTAQLSVGHTGGKTHRHSMSLINARYYENKRFFWDERAATLEEQVLQPIQDSIEMGMTLDLLVNRLKQKPYYPILFRKAFGTENITADLTAKALSQFVRSIVSYRSKYDRARSEVNKPNDYFPAFTSEENLGKSIFMNNVVVNCFGCHHTDLFLGDQPRNNGVQMDNLDAGIYAHTRQNGDQGKFKTPSLKSVMLRSRYMHNGTLKGIDAVIEHYNLGILPNPNLDNHLVDVNTKLPKIMNLTPNEIQALKAFLATLSDWELSKDEAFANPFR
ncbi:MAG: cytochrome-c peroxidase [Chitinophagaceae bacterium]